MLKPLSILFDEFKSYLISLERNRQKIESLCDQKALSRREIEQIYGYLFLNAVASFEIFIENMFLGLLTNRFKLRYYKINQKYIRITPRVTFKSDVIARDIVLSGRNYVNWLPYEDNTEKLSKIFFRNGTPFTLLDKKEKDNLKKIHLIRNSLAHKSRYSLDKFEKEVLCSIPLTKREKSPFGFLRSNFRSFPPQTRYENLISEISLIAKKICI